MEYLVSKEIVHRDLAVRNVLMRKRNEVEVTDFGLAKISNVNISESKLKVKPIRWTSLECLIGSEFKWDLSIKKMHK